MRISVKNETQTTRFARALARMLSPGDSVLLSGPLGAGKTVLARQIIRTLVGDPNLTVPSPSFTLVQPYQCPHFPLYHYDLWRLGDEEELEELAWDEAQEGVVIVEWPEILGDRAPSGGLWITLSLDVHNPLMRVLQLSGWSPARLKSVCDHFSHLQGET